MKIYLAGKMSGLSFEEMNGWRTKATQMLHRHDDMIRIENPCLHYNFENALEMKATDLEIRNYDLWLVRNCDVVLVNLDYQGSIGTAIELFEAYEHCRIPVIGYRTVEQPDHPWIQCSVTRECASLEDAIDYILTFIYPNARRIR